MLPSILLNTSILLTQATAPSKKFLHLQKQLESYGFLVNIALPPQINPPPQGSKFIPRVRRGFGQLDSSSKTVWINPAVFELGNSDAVLIHETIHAAQYCQGQGTLQTLNLDIEPIPQAQPFFKRYTQPQRQALEQEAYAVQTQPHSYELALTLLEKHCS